MGSAEILNDLVDTGGATSVRERDKNLRAGFVEGEKTGVFSLD
jgi:hypothetical protein